MEVRFLKEGTKDTAIALGSRLGVLAFGIGIQSALAWLLGTDGRGSYAVCLIFATILGIIFTFGTDRAGQYFVASGRMGRSEGVKSSLVLLIFGAALAVLVGRALMTFDFAFFQKAERSSFLIALGIIPFVGLTNAFALFFVGLRRFKWMAVVQVVNVAVHFAATLVLVIGLRLGVDGALLSIIIAGLVTTVVSLWLLRKEGALESCRRTAEGYRGLLSYGLRFFVAKLSNVFHFRIGTMILAFFIEPSGIGLFAAASALVMRVTIVPKAVETALFSRVAGHREGRPELVAQAGRASAVVAGVALGILAAVAVPLVRVLLSDEFLPAVPLIWIIMPGVFLRASTLAYSAYFMGTNRPAVCSVAVGVGTLVNVGVLLWLLPVIGLKGAAWAMTAGYLVSAVILVASFRRATGQPIGETWALRREDFALLRDVPRYLRRAGRKGGAAEGPEAM